MHGEKYTLLPNLFIKQILCRERQDSNLRVQAQQMNHATLAIFESAPFDQNSGTFTIENCVCDENMMIS